MTETKVVDEIELHPSSEYILVKVDKDKDWTRSAGSLIIVPEQPNNKKTQTGVIVAVGPGRRDPNNYSNHVPMDCEKGERILFACFIGYMVTMNGEDYVLIKYNDIMARVTEKSHIER